MTNAELIARLQTLDPNYPVMLECEDCYYSGPLTKDAVELGVVYRYESYTSTMTEDAYGKKLLKPITYVIEGDWRTDPPSSVPIVEEKPCIVIYVGR
jgi:hypothetical protein